MKRAAVENLVRRLRDEVDDDHFHMHRWLSRIHRYQPGPVDYTAVRYNSEADLPHCQTAGCIAGTVFLGLTPEQRADYARFYGTYNNRLVRAAAKDELDLTDYEAGVLFEPFSTARDFEKATRQRVIAMLEYMLEHNVIDWGRVMPDVTYPPATLRVVFT